MIIDRRPGNPWCDYPSATIGVDENRRPCRGVMVCRVVDGKLVVVRSLEVIDGGKAAQR